MDPESVGNLIDGLEHAFLADDDDALSKQREGENVRRLQEQYRAILRGDFPSFVNHLADDVEMEIIGPGEFPFVGHWRGRAPVVEALMRNFSMFEDQRPQLQLVVAQGDHVVITAREQGRYRPAQQEYQLHWVQFFTYRNGKLQRIRQIIDGSALLDAIRQAGP